LFWYFGYGGISRCVSSGTVPQGAAGKTSSIVRYGFGYDEVFRRLGGRAGLLGAAGKLPALLSMQSIESMR